MRVLICGSRHWCSLSRIIDELQKLIHEGNSIECVIHGDAHGADRISHTAATYLDIEIEVYPADWAKYGRAAGPIRNQQMLNEGMPTLVLAFHADIANSKGTADMVRRARKAGIPVKIITG